MVSESVMQKFFFLLKAAERVLTSLCGNDIQATFLGNAPCGFYQYQYPPASGMGTGAKVCSECLMASISDSPGG